MLVNIPSLNMPLCNKEAVYVQMAGSVGSALMHFGSLCYLCLSWCRGMTVWTRHRDYKCLL